MQYRYSTVAAPTYPTDFASARAQRSISRSISGAAATAGPSSTIFWWRRCTLQSRVNRDATLPCMSQISCTSRWRLAGASFMAKMGEPGTSP